MPFEDRYAPSIDQMPLHRMSIFGVPKRQDGCILGYAAGLDDLIPDTFVDHVDERELYLVVS